MTRKHANQPDCPCTACHELRETAVRLVDRDADLRDLVACVRPFVLAEREKRNPARPQNLSGGSYTVTHSGKGEYGEGEDSPWHENAVRELEDGA